MANRTVASLFTCLACVAGLAQQSTSLNGAWVMKYTSPTGRPAEARVVIADGSGTFQRLARNGEDPCVSVEAPIELSNVSNEGFELAVLASKVIPGCRDFRWQAKRVDDSTYEGLFGNGRRFVLLRR